MTSLDLVSQVKQSIATLTDPQLVPSDLTLTNCDREPIHIPSAIQAHGVLITCSEIDSHSTLLSMIPVSPMIK